MNLINFVYNINCLVLSFFSFIFNRLFRMVMRFGARVETLRKIASGKSQSWYGFSEILKQKRALPYFMATGPRWNCHAVLGIIRQFRVKSHINIHVETAFQSADQWTLVIYKREDNVIHISLGSLFISPNKKWLRVTLPNGIYRIVLRYYECNQSPAFPEINVDDSEKIAGKEIYNEYEAYQSFLHGIKNKTNYLYYFLHYYIFHCLRLSRNINNSFLKREFLPVGNPETIFKYGVVYKNDHLQLDCSEILLLNALVYMTIYNMQSLPVQWFTISQKKSFTININENGYYLVRIVPKNTNSELESHLSLNRISNPKGYVYLYVTS